MNGPPCPLRPLASVPLAYDRRRLARGIVHFGVGNFHRSHQAWYLHRLFTADPAQLEWGVCGIGLLPGDRAMRDALKRQDHLYALLEKRPSGDHGIEVIGSLVDYLFAPDAPGAVIERIADPATRLVTLTITEGGYETPPAVEAEAFAQQLKTREPLTAFPVTAFGFLAAGLARRRERGGGPLTVLSCDNILGNGDLTRRFSLEFAALGGPPLADWVRANVTFPNSMVDRITPVTSAADRADVHARDLDDAWPVPAEPFAQWVIEDNFAAGRPALERVGVQFVADVAPYEKMKLRLLNCSHQALAYFGVLLGHRFVHEAACDPDITRLVRRYMVAEATPTLDPVPGMDLGSYQNTLIERFQNPAIGDTLARICAFASDRIGKWLVPVIHAQVRAGGSVDCGAAIVASWANYLETWTARGLSGDVVDLRKDEIIPLADATRHSPAAFLSHGIFDGLDRQPHFCGAFLDWRKRIARDGPRAALQQGLA
jgi:mannitol 2-dehydrogenase